MRLYDKFETILSSDESNDPKEIKFKSEATEIELELLTRNVSRTESFAIGVHSIDFGGITEGKWFYIKPDKEITVKFNGSATSQTLYENKALKGWMKLTSLEVTTTEATTIEIEIAGT